MLRLHQHQDTFIRSTEPTAPPEGMDQGPGLWTRDARHQTMWGCLQEYWSVFRGEASVCSVRPFSLGSRIASRIYILFLCNAIMDIQEKDSTVYVNPKPCFAGARLRASPCAVSVMMELDLHHTPGIARYTDSPVLPRENRHSYTACTNTSLPSFWTPEHYTEC